MQADTEPSKNARSENQFKLMLSASGILGCIALLAYFSAPFVIFPFPQSNADSAQIIANVTTYQNYYLLAAWLQGTGTFLIVVFVIGLVYLSKAWNRFSGLMTLLASSTVLMLSLLEGIFFLETTQAVGNGHSAAAVTGFDLTFVFIHAFFIAPSLLLPLAFVLRRSDVLPRFFWPWALVLGSAFQTLGLVGLFLSSQLPAILLLVLMVVWVVAASVALPLKRAETQAFLSPQTERRVAKQYSWN